MTFSDGDSSSYRWPSFLQPLAPLVRVSGAHGSRANWIGLSEIARHCTSPRPASSSPPSPTASLPLNPLEHVGCEHLAPRDPHAARPPHFSSSFSKSRCRSPPVRSDSISFVPAPCFRFALLAFCSLCLAVTSRTSDLAYSVSCLRFEPRNLPPSSLPKLPLNRSRPSAPSEPSHSFS